MPMSGRYIAHIPETPWQSLVRRSIASWDSLFFRKDESASRREPEREILRSCGSLDEFLGGATAPIMFFFFQCRSAFLKQTVMSKWSRHRLNDYVLLPATPRTLSQQDCFFASHFWRSKKDPDRGGVYLRSFQQELRDQRWSFIWVDWTCTPQAPRSPAEESYFVRSLDGVSAIIRNCGFIWFYPKFEARMWILYEVAEFMLTNACEFTITPDIHRFVEHVNEMVRKGVIHVLKKYNYDCTYNRDKAFLTSWLELLVLLKVMDIDLNGMRQIMDRMTWSPTCEQMVFQLPVGVLILAKYEGNIDLNGRKWSFTPFENICELPCCPLMSLDGLAMVPQYCTTDIQRLQDGFEKSASRYTEGSSNPVLEPSSKAVATDVGSEFLLF